MKITATKEELKARLSAIQSVTGKASTMPILAHCLMAATKGGLTVTATDLTISIKQQLTANVHKEGAICIPAHKLYEIVTESEGDITLDANEEGTWLEIRSGKSKFRVSCLPAKEFPQWPDIKDGKAITFSSRHLTEMIAKTIYAASEADTRHTLNGLLFHMKPAGNKITIVGTDGHRLAIIGKDFDLAGWEETKAIVPKKALSELGKLIGNEGDVACSMGKSHILFEVGALKVLATLIEGSYPDYAAIIPHNNTNVVHVSRGTFMKAVKKVSIMAREGTKGIVVEIADKNMTMSSSNPEMGEANDQIPADYNGPEPIKTGFNAKYLLDAAASFKAEDITFSFATPFAPVLLTDKEDAGHACIIMPMRI